MLIIRMQAVLYQFYYKHPQNNINGTRVLCISTTLTIHATMTDHVSTLYADTLVFQFTEWDDDKLPDLRLYAVHDYERDTICVFGRRIPRKGDPNPERLKPFVFEFECAEDAYDFIRLSVDTSSSTRFDYALYSMSDLPLDINDFSFHLLENFSKRAREISAFDDMSFKKNRILDYLDVITSPIMDFGEADFLEEDYDM